MNGFRRVGTCGMLAVMMLAWLSPTNSAASSQCGPFEQVPSPDPATADTLSHLAALSDGTAWAVGAQSGETALLYFDGSAWTAQSLPAEVEGIAFADSTSTPDGDVWLTGTRTYSVYEVEVIFLRARNGGIDRIDHFLSPRAPIDISGTSATDVWALTGAGDVIHFDGSSWTETDVPAPFSRLYPRGVYAAGPNDVWAVGYGGEQRGEYIGFAQHWDGSSWTTVSTPFDGQRNYFFRGVDGSAADDAWIVGYINYTQTLALHWDGSVWTQYPGPPSDAPFLDVAVLAPDDAWATPYSLSDVDVLYHWDGNAWREVVPLAAPEGATVRWGELAKVGSCDLWTTGSYFIDPSNHTLVARLQPGAEASAFVQEVTVERNAPSTTVISWEGVSGASGYDLVRGDLSGLHDIGLFVSIEECVVDDQADTVVADHSGLEPDLGQGWWYLVRMNGSEVGTYDSGGTGQAESRDGELNASSASCP